MKSLLKRILLFVIDAVTLYLSYYVSFLVLNLIGVTSTDTLIENAYILVGVKIAVYIIFFMYSLNRYRSFILDVFGIIAANAAAVFAAYYFFNIPIMDNIIYYGIVLAFDLLISIMIRFLIRTSNNDYDEDDEDEDENDDLIGQNSMYQNSIFDPNFKQPDPQPIIQPLPQAEPEPVMQPLPQPEPEPEPIQQFIRPAEPDIEMIAMQYEKDRKIDLLTMELQDKEQRIQMLEDRISTQSNTVQQTYNTSESYINQNKKEILDKILDDIKSLYATLNSRSRLVEEREYALLLKMVELEEKERVLDDIQRQNMKIQPVRKGRYQKKAGFSPVYNLPSDNPDLANNILKTLEVLNVTPQAPITLAAAAKDEQYLRQQQIPQQEAKPNPTVSKPPQMAAEISIPKNQTPPSVRNIPAEEIQVKSQQPVQTSTPTIPSAPAQMPTPPINTVTPPTARVQPQAVKPPSAAQPKPNTVMPAASVPKPETTAAPAEMKPILREPIQAQASQPRQTAAEIKPKPMPETISAKAEPKPAETAESPKKAAPSEVDFHTVSLKKVDLQPDELDQISSLIDDL